jgi:hypothetical protein
MLGHLFGPPKPEQPSEVPAADENEIPLDLIASEARTVAAAAVKDEVAFDEVNIERAKYHLADMRAKAIAKDLFDAEQRGTAPDTWKRIDLSDHMNGTATPVVATMFARTDGLNLLYPGRTHSIFGESESGKSLIALAAAVREIMNGHPVLYIDYEDDEQTTAERLRMFGATPAAVNAHFDYRRPESRPADDDLSWTELLAPDRYTLAIIDGVTAALATFGTSSKDNDEVATWWQQLPERIARQTGAAVVMIDHVTKDKDSRGRFPIGAQTKMSSISGAAYIVETTGEPIGLGKVGALVMYVAKDRPGQVRRGCDNYNAGNRTHRVGTITVDSSTSRTEITIEAGGTAATDPTADKRNGTLLEAISTRVEDEIRDRAAAGHKTTTFSRNWIKTNVKGARNATKLEAIELLTAEGYFTSEPDKADRLTLARPYRRSADPYLVGIGRGKSE